MPVIKMYPKGLKNAPWPQKLFLSLVLAALLFGSGVRTSMDVYAQSIVDTTVVSDQYATVNTSMLRSMDSLLASVELMKAEREQFRQEFSRLNTRIQSLERMVQRKVDNLASDQNLLLNGMDTLRVLMPSDEPIIATNNNVIYLSQQQDSLGSYVERLEKKIVSLPDKHYWGVRNDFKEFDHLLLFTFLGALTSLGVVMLVKGGPSKKDAEKDLITAQEDEADRLSVSITLLVGSVLVILFILFIL